MSDAPSVMRAPPSPVAFQLEGKTMAELVVVTSPPTPPSATDMREEAAQADEAVECDRSRRATETK